MNLRKNFSAGFLAPYKGLLIFKKHPRLLKYILAPVLVLIGLGAGLVFYLMTAIKGWMTFFLLPFFNKLPFLGDLLVFMLPLLTFGLAITLVVFLVMMIYSLFFSPFYSFLAERCLSLLSEKSNTQGFKEALKFSIKMLFQSLLKSFMLLIAFLMFLAPIFLFPVVGFLWAAFIWAFDAVDYYLEIKGFNFLERFQFVIKEKWFFSGLISIFLVAQIALPFAGGFLIAPFVIAGLAPYFLHVEKLRE